MKITKINFLALVGAILIATQLSSCDKEKVKPKWEDIQITAKHELDKNYVIKQVLVTEDNEFFVIVKSLQHEYTTWVYYSDNEGASWSLLVNDGGAFGVDFNSMSFTGSWLYVAGSGTVGGRLYRTNTSGIFEVVYDLSGAVASPDAQVQFLSDDLGFVAGKYGFGKTTDAGNTWQEQFTNQAMKDVHFFDLQNGLLISADTVYSSTDGGDSWSPIANGSGFEMMSMQDATTGIIGGDKIWLTSDGGNNWTEIYNGSVQDVCLDSEGIIYAVNENGTVIRSSNLGGSWSNESNAEKDGFTCVHSNGTIVIAGVQEDFVKNNGDIKKKGFFSILKLKN